MSKTICGSHADYQARIDAYLTEHPSMLKHLGHQLQDFVVKMYNVDLTPIAWMLEEELYRGGGRPPRDPLCMLRSYLLSLACHVSITKWVDALHLVPLLAVFSGFDPADVPGVGTFYDFFDRLWKANDDNLSPRIHAPKKAKVAKPAHKGEKAESIEKETCAELYDYYEENDPEDMLPAQLLVALYNVGFLQHSIDLGVIPRDVDLAAAGDGTSVRTATRERSKPTCDCRARGITDCGCDREYSQPDSDYGWDSDSNCYYHGLNCYGFTICSLGHDLPVFAQLHPASRHDSKALIHTQANMDLLTDLPGMGLRISTILLDSAHDAHAIYKHYDEQDVRTFIDLNPRHGPPASKGDITFDKNGWPLCPRKLKMRRDGFEKARDRWKYRCPCMSRTNGELHCTCPQPCSESAYGRVVHVSGSHGLRFPANPARGTDEWKDIYKGRTAAERFNKRVKIDYKLESGSHRSTKMWYCRLYGIMMCLHLDAWDISTPPPFAKSESA